MADNSSQLPKAQVELPPMPQAQPRRPSLTQRMGLVSREWVNNFYKSNEIDDQAYGHGFNDQADDFVPALFYNRQERRRTSSVSSDVSEDGLGLRRSSISEQVAHMNLHRKPKSPLEGYALTTASIVDDQ